MWKYVFIRVVIKIEIFHSCHSRVVRVAVASHSCIFRVAHVSLVSLVSHTFRSCPTCVTLAVTVVFLEAVPLESACHTHKCFFYQLCLWRSYQLHIKWLFFLFFQKYCSSKCTICSMRFQQLGPIKIGIFRHFTLLVCALFGGLGTRKTENITSIREIVPTPIISFCMAMVWSCHHIKIFIFAEKASIIYYPNQLGAQSSKIMIG